MKQKEEIEVKESLVNPITGQKVDESISEEEAKSRGYLDLEFILAHLEDENEYVKYFVINGKKVIVHLRNPMTKYKKKPLINHERVLQTTTTEKKTSNVSSVSGNVTCSLDDKDGCISCSG